MTISRETWAPATRVKTLVSSHPAEAVRVVSKAVNMLVVSRVVVSSVAKKIRETWTMTKMLPALEKREVRIVAARIAS